MAGNILSALRERLRRDMNERADIISTGGCMSAGGATEVGMEYAKSVGIIEGLAMAERSLLDVVEELDKQEELDT